MVKWYSFSQETHSQSYGALPAIWEYKALPATRPRWTRPAITPARHVGARFKTYPGVDRRLSWPWCWLYTEMVTHLNSKHLIATPPAVKPTTSRLQVQRPVRYTARPRVDCVVRRRELCWSGERVQSQPLSSWRRLSAVCQSRDWIHMSLRAQLPRQPLPVL